MAITQIGGRELGDGSVTHADLNLSQAPVMVISVNTHFIILDSQSTTTKKISIGDLETYFNDKYAAANHTHGGGGITGSGTVNRVVKYTTANTVGDTNISDNGTVVSILTDLVINGLPIGRGAGNFLSNLVFGEFCLGPNTTGQNNLAFSTYALASNTTGGNNIAIGNSSLFATQGTSFQVGLGAISLAGIISGNSNIGVGYKAGRYLANGTTSLTNSNTSIFIGQDSRALADGQSNQIVIGDTAIGEGTNSVVLGNDLITKTILKGSVLIGTATTIPSSKLTVTSTTQGFLPPRMTNTQMLGITTPTEGLLAYDNTNKKLSFFNGTSWGTVGPPSGTNGYFSKFSSSGLVDGGMFQVGNRIIIPTTGYSDNTVDALQVNGSAFIGDGLRFNPTYSIIKWGTDTWMGMEYAGTFQIRQKGDVAISAYQYTLNNQSFMIKMSGNVLINTETEIPSAQLNVTSTNRGFLPPRMTNTQMLSITTPAEGLIVYDNTNKKHSFYDGTAWSAISSGSGGGGSYLPLAGGTLTGALIGTTATFNGEVKSSVTDAFTSFVAYNPGAGYPRGLFKVGRAADDINTGLTFAPEFTSSTVSKPFAIEVYNNKLTGTGIAKMVGMGIYDGYASIHSLGASGNSAGLPLVFSTQTYGGNNSAIYISSASTQFVGFGTSTPQAKVDIQSTTVGSADAPLFFRIRDSAGNTFVEFGNKVSTVNGGRGYMTLKNPTGDGTGSGIDFKSGLNDVNSGLLQLDGSGNMVFRTNGPGMYFDGNGVEGMYFRTNTGTHIRVLTNGNVGFGNSNPQKRIDVNGDILVNGIPVGRGAGNFDTNIVMGPGAFTANTGGQYNIVLGTNSFANATGSSFNVVIGYGSMISLTSGQQNIGIGVNTLVTLTNGGGNTALGFSALFGLITGEGMTGIGQNAGRWLPDGSNFTAGTNSFYLGADTRASFNGVDNEIVIGNSAVGNGYNSVTIGNTATTKTILKGNLFVGLTNGTINDSNKIQVGGYVLATGYKVPGGLSTGYLMADGSIGTGGGGGSAEPSQIIITTTGNITTDTLDANGKSQHGKNVIIDNGAFNITVLVKGGSNSLISYLKHGTGTITFIQDTNRTLSIPIGQTALMNGLPGSTATISTISTTDYLKVNNE